MSSAFRYLRTSPEIIRLAVMLCVRFPLSLRNVEDLLHERGIDVSHETVRFWWNEPVRSGLRRPDQEEAIGGSARLAAVALPTGRDAREDPRRGLPSLTRRRSRRRGAQGVRRQTPGSQGRAVFKVNRCAALAEWRQLCAVRRPTKPGSRRLSQVSLTPPANYFAKSAILQYETNIL